MMGKLLRFKRQIPGVFVSAVSLVLMLACSGGEDPEGPSRVFKAEGSNTWVVGGFGDNMTYSGDKYTQTTGSVSIDVDDATNEGELVAKWVVTDWKYDASQPLATGTMKIIWTDFFGDADFMDGGIANELVLHGDSGNEAPVLPTVYTYSAGWGAADIFLNDEPIYEDVLAHYMVTEGTRDPATHAVHESEGKGIFVPTPKGGDSGNGFTYPIRNIIHVIVHTEVRDPNNWPPFTMFMHVNFEDPITMSAQQATTEQINRAKN